MSWSGALVTRGGHWRGSGRCLTRVYGGHVGERLPAGYIVRGVVQRGGGAGGGGVVYDLWSGSGT